MVKSTFICFGFQKTFRCTDVYCTLGCLFVLLSIRLRCARLVVHSFTGYFMVNRTGVTTLVQISQLSNKDGHHARQDKI